MATVLVPASRVERWVANFATRHGGAALAVSAGALQGTAEDGSTFRARLPFAASYDGAASAGDFAGSVATPEMWGVLLVRKGGFAIARLEQARMVESKVGQRHVQGRTKAGGQSQQRFARRRDNQARQAYEAAAGHAVRLIGDRTCPVVVGGDRSAIEAVLEEQRLVGLQVVEPWLTVPDPRRAVLEQAVADACAASFDVHNV